MTGPLSTRQIWGMPVALGVATAVGLLSALLGDGLWDGVSWISLGWPIAVILRSIARTGR
ncbi:MAG: hypothetical protein GDA68_00705 [Nitrospira sp. CR2.1]|nr:hypothetical protein [Nitrospira sp. CR2.1]